MVLIRDFLHCVCILHLYTTCCSKSVFLQTLYTIHSLGLRKKKNDLSSGKKLQLKSTDI